MRALVFLAALLVPARVSDLPPVPRSLVATDVDRQGTKRLFDYFLSASGEEPATRIRERITAEAPGSQDLLDRYLALRDAVQAQRVDPATDLETRLRRLHDLRVAYLGAETAEAFFGLEEAEADVALARMRGVETPLSPAEHEAILPLATMRKEAGLSPAEVRALRVATFGPEAAERLAALDRERSLRK